MRNKIIGLTIAAATLQFLAACETTGNPNEGGIFWSESKAQDRLRTREDQLSRVERDTARQNTAAERRRRMLGD